MSVAVSCVRNMLQGRIVQRESVRVKCVQVVALVIRNRRIIGTVANIFGGVAHGPPQLWQRRIAAVVAAVH